MDHDIGEGLDHVENLVLSIDDIIGIELAEKAPGE